jgi:hypothetical protein
MCAPVVGGPVKRCLAWSTESGTTDSLNRVFGVKRLCAQRSNFGLLKAVEYLPDSPM